LKQFKQGNIMNTTTIIVGIVLLAAFVVPVIWLNRKK